jgi:hypothetical protein
VIKPRSVCRLLAHSVISLRRKIWLLGCIADIGRLCMPKTSSNSPELAGIRWLAWRRLVCSSTPSAATGPDLIPRLVAKAASPGGSATWSHWPL